jgi:hypothetical protein
MSEQSTQLLRTAHTQISELIELFSGRDEDVLAGPCPGRAKLGDGTIGAVALHTAENYARIASFLANQSDGGHADARSGRAITLPALLELLVGSRDALQLLGNLSDERLGTVPPAGLLRFCDGNRTLQEVLAGMLAHQAHNVETLKAAAS